MKVKNAQMISSKKEIKFVLEKGKRFFGKFLTFIYVHDDNLFNNFELLISVPKKKIKLAVNRNKIKRRIRSFYFDSAQNNLKQIRVIVVYHHFKPIKFLKLKEDMIAFEKKLT